MDLQLYTDRVISEPETGGMMLVTLTNVDLSELTQCSIDDVLSGFDLSDVEDYLKRKLLED
jgi:hypothetical protein